MKIRDIKTAELSSLLSLYADLHDDETPSAPDQAQTTWNIIQDNPGIRYFGVFLDSKLVSSCTITVIPNLTRNCRPYGVIENVVTGKDYRGQGLGKAVLQHALDHAW